VDEKEKKMIKKIGFGFLALILLVGIYIATYGLPFRIFRAVVVENQTNYIVQNLVVEIKYGNKKRKRFPVGILQSNSSDEFPLESGDALLFVEFKLRGNSYRIPCNYTSNGVSHKLVISPDPRRIKCNYLD
jgi:hypothetical protein